MRHLLLVAIRLYWRWWPAERRRHCLFAETCSQYVYRHARQEGLASGLQHLHLRARQCRPGYALRIEGAAAVLVCADGTEVPAREAATWLQRLAVGQACVQAGADPPQVT